MNSTVNAADILTGDKLAQALRSGAHRVLLQQDYLNRINVFPVADGDTGTNLSLSLGAMLGTLNTSTERRLDFLLAAIADALLDGARGNSGAIMAQFFQGLSDAVVGQQAFTADSFSQAVELGCQYAHDAVAQPQEGTILTVISAFSTSLREQLQDTGESSFACALDTAQAAAECALSNTTTQLEALRKAGVVDAGAMGFVVMLGGMIDFLVRGQMTEAPDFVDLLTEAGAAVTAGDDADLQYRFCTECMIAGENIDRRKLRESLDELGSSLVLAGSARKAKIHIHVNDPEAVFDLARHYGTLSKEKADDMLQQRSSSHEARAKFAVITDSAADIPDADMERLDIHMVPLRIQIDDRGYLDKVSISPDKFFAELARNTSIVSSSQPTPGDFRRQYQFLASHFPDVISISLTGSVSGTLQAARSAADRVAAHGKVHVFDSLNASLGQGLLVVFAAECAASGCDIKSTLRALQDMRSSTRSFALIKDFSYAVRGGRVSGYVKKVGDLLRVTPLLGTTTDGRIRACGILAGRKNLLPRFAKFVARRARRSARVCVSVGHACCEEDARLLLSLLQERLPTIVTSSITELGSAFGVHGGPGTLLVGIQTYRDPAELS